ncbi:hypothetical protein ACTXML_16010 [Glutamicibacter arilaitensis]|uniref:hypothetical protein n=1 Tax=Glutamicibacter arilaitensis TaxID=256701 RepID=UPI003FD3188C
MNKAIFIYDQLAVCGPSEEHHTTAIQLRQALGLGVLGSLGASDLTAVPGTHQRGGLLLTARVLPMTKRGTRGTRPRKMGIMISLTPADEVEIEAREIARGTQHAKIEGIGIEQLQRAALAIDYDGSEVLNPRYWTN